jgi:Flp pilus assembly protein TadG
MRRNQQSGQVLVFLALAIVVLAGMLGLVIDGGIAQDRKQLSQRGADAAALAAAYTIQQNPATATLAGATAAADQAAHLNGNPPIYPSTPSHPSTVTLTYLDVNRASTLVPANVVFVDATVTLTSQTLFLRVVGYNSFTLSSFAEAKITAPQRTCAVCLMAPTGNSAHFTKDDTMTITGAGLIVDSNSGHAVMFDGQGTVVTSPGIYTVGGSQNSKPNVITCTPPAAPTPCPQEGIAPITDPDAAAPYPSVATPRTYVRTGTTTTILPGVYSGLNIAAGDTVIMSGGGSNGIYVFTGNITMNGNLDGSAGVMVYLTCPGYSTANLAPCASPGQVGAAFDEQGGIVQISPPTSGDYKGLSVFADRNNIARNTLGAGTPETVGGTWYTLLMPFAAIHASTTVTLSNFIVDSFDLIQNTTFNISYDLATAYYPPGGPGGSARLTLNQ